MDEAREALHAMATKPFAGIGHPAHGAWAMHSASVEQSATRAFDENCEVLNECAKHDDTALAAITHTTPPSDRCMSSPYLLPKQPSGESAPIVIES